MTTKKNMSRPAADVTKVPFKIVWDKDWLAKLPEDVRKQLAGGGRCKIANNTNELWDAMIASNFEDFNVNDIVLLSYKIGKPFQRHQVSYFIQQFRAKGLLEATEFGCYRVKKLAA